MAIYEFGNKNAALVGLECSCKYRLQTGADMVDYLKDWHGKHYAAFFYYFDRDNLVPRTIITEGAKFNMDLSRIGSCILEPENKDIILK